MYTISTGPAEPKDMPARRARTSLFAWCLLAPMAVMACGPASAAATPRQSPSTVPHASSPPASVVGAPAADQGAELSCRVPISGFNPGSGGFVTFPGGRFTPEPASNVPLPANTVSTGAYTYDRAFSRWLPVPRDWVSPDGTRYAFSDRDGVVHVVDVASGADRRLVLAGGVIDPSERWTVIDFESDAVYLTASPRQGGFPIGLWVSSPTDGSVRQLADRGYWQALDPTAAWGTPDAPTSAGAGDATLLRLDLKTGANVAWFRGGAAQLVVLGLDGASPLVMTTTAGSTEVWSVPAPGSSTKIYSGPGQEAQAALRVIGTGVKDAHGLWLGSPDGLLLYVQGTGFRRMSSAAGWVAGPCF